MCARVLHVVRDSSGDGSGLRSLPGARLLLTGRRTAGTEWWTSFFDARYLHEYEPTFSLVRDRQEVARVLDVLGLPLGARVLDAACGQGRHAHLLADAGLEVDGVDYSEELLSVARRRGSGNRLRYTQADMRSLPADWASQFDAVVSLSTSFGFFRDPADDVKAIGEFARVLKPGGILLWHGASRDGVVARFLARDWWTTTDGTTIAQQRTFDPLSGLLNVESRSSGPAGEVTRIHHLRLYTATRLAELFATAGLLVESAWDGWRDRPVRRTSSEMLLVARKSVDDGGAVDELPRRLRRR